MLLRNVDANLISPVMQILVLPERGLTGWQATQCSFLLSSLNSFVLPGLAAMDFFMGLKGKDFIVVCSDTVASQSIIRMKADEEKMVPIDEHKLFVMSGGFSS